jgi:hypothetical protein
MTQILKSNLTLFESHKFPRTRYQGSKYKLQDWIKHHLESLDSNTALDAFKSEGLKIISEGKEKLKPLTQSSSQDGLDFSSFKVESFKQIDGLEYQKGIRDEW